MRKALWAAAMLASFSVGFQMERSHLTEVQITLTAGTKFSEATKLSAEILAVRDSAIVVANPAGLSEDELLARPEVVTVLPYSRIESIRTLGEAHPFLGLFAGLGAGCVGGCALGMVEATGGPAGDLMVQRGVQGCWGGGLVGTAIGTVWDRGLVLISSNRRDFQVLTKLARYPLAEPASLRSIAP